MLIFVASILTFSQSIAAKDLAAPFHKVVRHRGFLSRYRKPRSFVGKTVVICGPSGVGKGTIINFLLKQYPAQLELCVSHTSRPPRRDEINGTHYYFIDNVAFEKDLKYNSENFLEYARVHGNLYGTHMHSVRAIHEANKLCIMDIDTAGVESVRKSGLLNAKFIFIAPRNMSVLEERLVSRGTESADDLRLRLLNAHQQIEYALHGKSFDAIIYNDDLETTAVQISRHLHNWFPNFLQHK